MFASRVEIVSFLAGAASLLLGAEGVVFSYDPSNSDVGPSKWGDLATEQTNVCNGTSNSPIDVETSCCTSFENYTFNVSTSSSLGE
jgi:carbonic anhydrase